MCNFAAMFFRLCLILVLASSQFSVFSSVPLSENARISLITCGPGGDLYSTFGHSAIHIYDTQAGIDKVYNYGTFDFDTPNFYTKFTQGKLNYTLAVSDFDRFIRTYQYEGRWVYRQDLRLTGEEKQAVYAFLENNALPENKDYKYDFFYDNCSTRIRDVFEDVLGKNLSYPDENRDTTATFRQLIDLYLTNHPWSDLGIDLALGFPCDYEAGFRQKMFLPDYLMAGMENAVVTRDGSAEALVGNHGLILPQHPELDTSETQSIAWIFWIFFGICFLSGIFWPAERMRWFDVTFFAIAGILGIFVLLLWFATDHTATKWNMNILWALPSWLYGAYILSRRKPISRFFKIHAIILFFVIISWMWIPQNLHVAAIPIVLALLVRSWAWQKKVFRKKAI